MLCKTIRKVLKNKVKDKTKLKFYKHVLLLGVKVDCWQNWKAAKLISEMSFLSKNCILLDILRNVELRGTRIKEYRGQHSNIGTEWDTE